jgi:hypothetical protein
MDAGGFVACLDEITEYLDTLLTSERRFWRVLNAVQQRLNAGTMSLTVR